MALERILFISNLYPNPNAPHLAPFSRQQIDALRERCHVDVIAPVPWHARLGRHLPASYQSGGDQVHHPLYLYPPGMLRSLYGRCYLASVRRTALRLLERQRYDCIYASWLYPDGWAAAKLAAACGKPLFVRVAGTDVNRLLPGDRLTRQSLWVVERASRVLAVSERLKERLVSLGAEPEKIEVIYNGVDRSIFRPVGRGQARAELAVPADRKVILFVGNLKKEKGVFELLSAFKSLAGRRGGRELSLVVIGRGPCEAGMRAFAEEGALSGRISFLGSRPQREISAWMNACDVFCLPSYMEGMPNVVIEALACRARVVATNVGGIPELAGGGRDLLLVEPRSALQLEEALAAALHGEQPAAGDRCFIHSWQENASRLLELFHRHAAAPAA